MRTHLVGLYLDGSWFVGDGHYVSFHLVNNLNKHIYGYNIFQIKKEIVSANGIAGYSGLEMEKENRSIIK